MDFSVHDSRRESEDIYQNVELDPVPFYKISPNCIKNLNIEIKTIKFFSEEAYRRKSLWLWGTNGHSNNDTNHEKAKEKYNNITTLNLRFFVHQNIP